MNARRLLCISPRSFDIALCDQLPASEWDVHVARDLNAARRLLGEHSFLVGLLLLSEIDPGRCAEFDDFLHAHDTLEWVGGFKPGALELPACRDLILDRMFDHLTMPVDAQRLAATLGHAYGHATLRLGSGRHETDAGSLAIVGRSPAMARLLRQVGRIAKVDAPALVCGESGSGKELVAQAIHDASRRSNGPFVVVNCGAIPAALIQSELFGHEKGSFTGAGRQTRGLIEAASGGTVFLDEIGDLPLELQTNLLRFLQESTIDRVGSTRSIRVDVRVIAATNVDLETAVSAGAFRKDLFYRLNVLPLWVPPLRERSADIELLAQHFFHKFGSERSRKLKGFSRRALIAMAAHDWPGNVRELINRIRRAMVLAEGKLIQPADLGLEHLDAAPIRVPLDEARMAAERHAISGSLQYAGRNVSHAAKQLGISRMTLYRLMAKHRIDA
ncbi:MAG: sigma-54-dependent Fis family transcriptional regulator [Burkholderiales bacterium]|nr:sigma-54-dependent Fis family transcriptional regulator [Burkholderiales bacterium]